MKKALLLLTALLPNLLLTPSILANPDNAIPATTCPTKLEQNKAGYWLSSQVPRWKSHRPTSKKITVNAKDFGGVVFSAKKSRIACVYKASNGRWVALISDVNHAISQDDLVGNAWQYSSRHKDYICGKPKNTLSECKFIIKK